MTKSQSAQCTRWAMWNYPSWENFCNSSVPFLPNAHARRNVILWMWLLSLSKRRHNQQDQSKISSFDSTELSCSSESFKRKKARRSTDGKKIIGKLWMSSEVRKKNNHSSILDRWHNNERYKKSEVATEWNETHRKYLDHLTTIYIAYNAPYHQRYRHENTNTMKSSDSDLEAGSMVKRADYKAMTELLYCLRQKQGKANSYIQKERERGNGTYWTRNFKSDWSGSAKIGENISPLLRSHLPCHWDKVGGETRTGRMIAGKITDGTIIRGKNINGEQRLNWEQMFWKVSAYRI